MLGETGTDPHLEGRFFFQTCSLPTVAQMAVNGACLVFMQLCGQAGVLAIARPGCSGRHYS